MLQNQLFFLCSRCVANGDRPSILIDIDGDGESNKHRDGLGLRRRISLDPQRLCERVQAPPVLVDLLHSHYRQILFLCFDDDELLELLTDDAVRSAVPRELEEVAMGSLKATYYILKCAQLRVHELQWQQQRENVPPLLKKDEMESAVDSDHSGSENEAIYGSENEAILGDRARERLHRDGVKDEEERMLSSEDEDEGMSLSMSDTDGDSDDDPILSTLQRLNVQTMDCAMTGHFGADSLAMPALEEGALSVALYVVDAVIMRHLEPCSLTLSHLYFPKIVHFSIFRKLYRFQV